MSRRWAIGGLALGGLVALVYVGVEHRRLQAEIADVERQCLDLEQQLVSRDDRRMEVAELMAAGSRLGQTEALVRSLKQEQLEVTELDRLLREAAASGLVDLRSAEWDGDEIRVLVRARTVAMLACFAEECVSRVGLKECRLNRAAGSVEGDSFVICGRWSGIERGIRSSQMGGSGS